MSRPRPLSNVVFRELPQGAVLFSTATEVYFSLNSAGVKIWRLLSEGADSVELLVSRLSEQFPEVPRETLRADVESLLAELVANGLAESVPAGT